jgi:hypothetical protein
MPEASHTETVEHLMQRLASLCMHVTGFKEKLFDDNTSLEYRRHLARVEDDIFNALAHLRSLHGSIRKDQNTYRGRRHD